MRLYLKKVIDNCEIDLCRISSYKIDNSFLVVVGKTLIKNKNYFFTTYKVKYTYHKVFKFNSFDEAEKFYDNIFLIAHLRTLDLHRYKDYSRLEFKPAFISLYNFLVPLFSIFIKYKIKKLVKKIEILNPNNQILNTVARQLISQSSTIHVYKNIPQVSIHGNNLYSKLHFRFYLKDFLSSYFEEKIKSEIYKETIKISQGKII